LFVYIIIVLFYVMCALDMLLILATYLLTYLICWHRKSVSLCNVPSVWR